MLITVKKSKLVLGHTVYGGGDVFECRDAEAKLLIASGMATKSPPGAKATKGSPTAPTTGMSTKKGTLPASPETPAPSIGRGRRAAAAAASPSLTPAPAPAARPVGAMTMPERTATQESANAPAATPKE